MTNILSIETSTAACSVALASGGEVVQRSLVAPREHAQLILPWVQSLLAEAGLVLKQLDAIAVGQGPGGFTGVRIGMGIVQGLAMGADLPVVPVSSLRVLAQSALAQLGAETVLVAQDARMNEVYSGIYARDKAGFMGAISDDQLSPASAVAFPIGKGQWHPVGDAWQVYPECLKNRLPTGVVLPTEDVWPEARYLSFIAMAMFKLGVYVKPEEALPVYLRGKEAWSLKS